MILVVEDDPDVREAYEEVLEQAGYDVETAANGKLALDRLRGDARAPDLVLLDLMMPVMDGFQLRKVMVADDALRDIPVIVVTACRDDPQLPCVRRLLKPVPFEDLLDAVARVLHA
jgi:CheY-like chemotaxis protein